VFHFFPSFLLDGRESIILAITLCCFRGVVKGTTDLADNNLLSEEVLNACSLNEIVDPDEVKDLLGESKADVSGDVRLVAKAERLDR